MLPLQGVGVLVTRPEQQSASLCRLLEASGASTWRLPAIEIRPIRIERARGDAWQQCDLVLFTSVNAVRFGLALLGERSDLELGAIGPATARALEQGGRQVAILPGGGADSETLLEHPRLKHLTGRRVLLVKGRGGRRLLEEELVRRGAQLKAAEVYERVPAEPDAAALAQVQTLAEHGELQVVTATSAEIGVQLLQIAPPGLRAAFERLHWLVPGARVAEQLRARGLGAPTLVASSAEDQELVSALESWRGAASGA